MEKDLRPAERAFGFSVPKADCPATVVESTTLR